MKNYKKIPTLALTLCLALSVLLPQTSRAQRRGPDQTKPIEPPFGLVWGEPPDNVVKWADSNQYTTTTGKAKDGREVIEIEGPFPEANFNRLRFYFSNSQLTEVELQFNRSDPSGDRDTEFMAFTEALAVKGQIDEQLGKGTLIKNERGNSDGKAWQFIQQIWTDEQHSIWLAVFSATSPQEGSLTITSLHYRWEEKLLDKKVDKTTPHTPSSEK